jgi:hypothetical protein
MYDVWEDHLGPGLDIANLEVNYGPIPGVTSYCFEPDNDPAKVRFPFQPYTLNPKPTTILKPETTLNP